MLAAGCSSLLGDTPVESGTESDTTEASGTESTSPTAACVRFTGDHSAHINSGSLATDALSLSGEIFVCADDVVVVGPDDVDEVAAASQLAAALTAPLLFPEPRLSAELGRLKPERVHVIGPVQVNVPGGADTVIHDISSAAALTKDTLGAAEEVALPSIPNASTIIETVAAISTGNSVAVPVAPPTSSTAAAPGPSIEVGEVVVGLATPSDADSLWMVDASSPETILLAAAVGNSINASVVAIDGTDILGYPEVGDALIGHDQSSIRYVGATPEASDWELQVLANGVQVPGGGFLILPEDALRRYVAFYGHPGTASLGVLGEQGPAETRTRMQEFVDAYSGDGAQVIPTYEIIATVASAGPGDDGDYSTEWPPENFDEWIDYAGANGMYVLLDLQSGREDFLSQAMIYEEHLKLPHVGLALDPEWRLTDDQVHLVQAGTVDAAEINTVVAWLGDLVRDNGLPQKMLLLHQFKTSMITNRDQIVLRPELQTVIQMDGDGTEPQKDGTWRVLREGPDAGRYAWGWKNFFDEDEPGPPSPANTMAKEPTPILVSYQ